MKLTVNGNPHEHAGDGSLDALLRELGADPARVALMVNDKVIGRDARVAVRLQPRDRVEVLVFAGGG